jgi:hypothetical protein
MEKIRILDKHPGSAKLFLRTVADPDPTGHFDADPDPAWSTGILVEKLIHTVRRNKPLPDTQLICSGYATNLL